jgi:drug/metabolite transporter (DMT)-like permease
MRWTARRAMLALILANVLWAGSYTAAKEALDRLSLIELNFLRFGVASLILLAIVWQQRQSLHLRRRDLPRLALLCLCGFVLNKSAEFGGLSLTTASDTALLIASESMFTAILAWIVLREAVQWEAVVGLIIGAIGVYIVIERGFGLPSLGGGTRLIGDLLIVGALTMEATYTVLGKDTLDRYPGLVITTCGIAGSMAFWTPAVAIHVAVAGMPHLSVAGWLGVLYLAVAATVMAYTLWMVALKHVDAASAAPTLFLQPLLGTAIAIAVLGERPSWTTLLGGAIIMLGVWTASRAESREALRAAVDAEALAG